MAPEFLEKWAVRLESMNEFHVALLNADVRGDRYRAECHMLQAFDDGGFYSPRIRCYEPKKNRNCFAEF